VVLAGADSLRDPRKGFDLLVEAWNRIRPKDATLALFGRHGNAGAGQAYLGSLNSDEQMVAAYRAADLYVHPARMENAPCTIQESLACGTPVVAFRVGGIPEMVNDGRTGLLCASISADALAGALQAALSDAGRLEEMRKVCRNQPANEGLEGKVHLLMCGATGTG
jgi:glycosyltransferase involved in cell wall biosynthesis